VDYWMNERNGTTLSDSSGLTNTGVFAGAPIWTNGVQGDGLLLNPGDGTEDYVTTANAASLENLQEGNYSVTAWFKPLSLPPGSGSQNNAHYGIIMKKGYNLGLEYDNQGKFIMDHWLTGNVGAAAGSSASFATGVFHHVVGVVDRSAGATRLYVNGALAGSAAFTPGTAARDYGTEPWRTGIAAPGAGTYRWPAHAVVDEVQLFSGALTGPDVSNLYASVEHNLVLDCWMDEGAGATAADHSGEGNNGTLTGSPIWTTGVLFNGIRLNPDDGTDDYVAIPNSTSLQNVQENNYTLSAWFKPLSVPVGSGSQNNAAYALLIKKGNHAGLKYDNQGRFLMDLWMAGGVTAGAVSTSSYATGVFHHVVGVVDRTAGQTRLYVNGALAGSASFTAGAAVYEHGTESWRIGIAAPGAATYRWPAHGDVDEAQVYSRALSAGDVQNLYAAQTP